MRVLVPSRGGPPPLRLALRGVLLRVEASLLRGPTGRRTPRFGRRIPSLSFDCRRSRASSRLRAWLRASWATAVTRSPSFWSRRARCAPVEAGGGGDVEHSLDPGGRHVRVLAAGARGAAGAQLDLVQGDLRRRRRSASGPASLLERDRVDLELLGDALGVQQRALARRPACLVLGRGLQRGAREQQLVRPRAVGDAGGDVDVDPEVVPLPTLRGLPQWTPARIAG